MDLQIFSGSYSQELCSKIINSLKAGGKVAGKIYLHKFPSGEHYCQYLDNIRGGDVFLVQSIVNPAHERLMELLVMIDAAKRASAKRITVVAPYLGYLRQDRKTKSRTPITAKLVADLITSAGAHRLLGVDFHCEQAQGFFNIPVDHLYAMEVLKEHVLRTGLDKNTIIVSPDAGGIKRASAFAATVKTDFAFISKKRKGDSEVESQGLVGDVSDRDVLIVDDMTESCGTLLEAARVCISNGALTVRAAVTHALLNDIGLKRLNQDNTLKELIVTDTVPLTPSSSPITVLSIAPLLAKAIMCIHLDQSVSDLFEIKGF